MGLVGSLEDLSLLDILQIVNVSRRTGILRVQPPEGDASFVFFKGGAVQDIAGGYAEGGFLNDFVTQGLLEESELSDAMSTSGADAIKTIRTLIDMGVLNERLVEQAHRQEIARRLRELTQYGQGLFAFYLSDEEQEQELGAPPPPLPLAQPASPQNLLTEDMAASSIARKHSEAHPEPHRPPPSPTPPPPPKVEPWPVEVVAEPDQAAPPTVEARVVEPVPEEHPKPEVATVEALEEEARGAPQEYIPHAEVVEEIEEEEAAPEVQPAPQVVHRAQPQATFQAAKNKVTIVLAGDDSIFKNLLWQRLMAHFDQVERILSTGEFVSLCRSLLDKRKPFAALVDLLMPTQDGKGYLGGLEILEAAQNGFPQVKVLLMNDLDDPRIIDMAKAKGAVAILKKPDLAKLRIGQLEEAIGDFAQQVCKEVERLLPQVEEEMASFLRELGAEAVDEGYRVRDQLTLLKGLMGELASPRESSEISLLVLRLASEYFERAVLFLVKKDEIIGLGGFGETGDREMMMQKVKRVRMPADASSILGDSIRERSTFKKESSGFSDVDRDFAEALGTFSPKEMVAIPMVSRGRVIAILYADNAVSSSPIPDISGIEIFMAQAGLAMEKALLERQLTSLKKSISTGPGKTE